MSFGDRYILYMSVFRWTEYEHERHFPVPIFFISCMEDFRISLLHSILMIPFQSAMLGCFQKFYTDIHTHLDQVTQVLRVRGDNTTRGLILIDIFNFY